MHGQTKSWRQKLQNPSFFPPDYCFNNWSCSAFFLFHSLLRSSLGVKSLLIPHRRDSTDSNIWSDASPVGSSLPPNYISSCSFLVLFTFTYEYILTNESLYNPFMSAHFTGTQQRGETEINEKIFWLLGSCRMYSIVPHVINECLLELICLFTCEKRAPWFLQSLTGCIQVPI